MKYSNSTIIYQLLFVLIITGVFEASAQKTEPNILWIVTEDMSAHFSFYGEKSITTPHLDRMAAEGIRFDNVFVTGPVCSPSRSAMVTGMYQTVLGSHNHRSQRKFGDRDGNTKKYADTYTLPVKSVSKLFAEKGYHTCNGNQNAGQNGKEDYNLYC
jgi:arylsulfatase A-like enzyme